MLYSSALLHHKATNGKECQLRGSSEATLEYFGRNLVLILSTLCLADYVTAKMFLGVPNAIPTLQRLKKRTEHSVRKL